MLPRCFVTTFLCMTMEVLQIVRKTPCLGVVASVRFFSFVTISLYQRQRKVKTIISEPSDTDKPQSPYKADSESKPLQWEACSH